MTGTVRAASRLAGVQVPRGRIRAELVYLGWRYVTTQPDPGPMPEPPPAAPLDEVSPDWVAAQRREQDLLARPARLGTAASIAAGGGAAACWLAGVLPAGVALLAVAAAAAGFSGRMCSVVRGERALRAQLRAEHDRVQRIREVQQAEQAARRVQHARRHREWQQQIAVFCRQPQWYPVTLPVSISRLDVAGGTLAGWSALITMIAATRLAVGGEVTVLDLTEGGVAADLVAFASQRGISPRVWLLPANLPSLDLGAGLSPESLADVLALTAAASDPGGACDPARDSALIRRVLHVLGCGASLRELMAALRLLAQLGDPREQLSGGELSAAQLSGLAGTFGREARQLLVDRAGALEARLRPLSPLGTALTGKSASRLRVAWPDRSVPGTGNRVLGIYLAVAMTEVLRQAPAGVPWQQTVCLLGADRLPAEVLDRICDAAEGAGAGLVVGYRSIPGPMRQRLGRGNAAVAFMRLGNAEDARAAADQIGSEHRFVLSQLTDSVGSSVTGTSGDSYTGTAGTADSLAGTSSASWTAGHSRGHNRQGNSAPFTDGTGSASRDASSSVTGSDSWSVTEGISSSTSWGWSTSRAVGANRSQAGTVQRSRELLVEQHELQHLPHTAVLLCHSGPGGRHVVLADANPAIMTLPTATLAGRQPDAAAG